MYDAEKKILLVEDEVVIAMLEKQQLENIGYSVNHVTTGEDAVQQVVYDGFNYDLILMDIDLGYGLDGTQAAEQILDMKDMPVVFLSSHTEPEVVEKTDNITSYGYVVKNSGIVVLNASIKMALRLFEAKMKQKETEKELENTLEVTTDGIWTWNFKTDTLYFSPRFYSMLHYEPFEFAPSYEAWKRLLHPDDKDALSVADLYLQTKPDVYENEFRMSTKDGSYRWIHAKAHVVRRDKQGRAEYMIGNHEDVTERRQFEVKLRESELQFRNIANAGLALIWRSGTDKLCDYFNEPWLRFTGRTMEQELGSGWTEGVHPEDLERCLEIYTTAFDKRIPFEMEYRLRHASGEYRYILDLGTPNYNTEGLFLGYFGHCFDITDRKRNEEKIKQQLQEKETLLKEVHHRIKNSVAQVEALLLMQEHSVDDPIAKTHLQGAIARVQSIRVLYEKLLIGNDYQDVSIKSYIESLVNSFAAIFHENDKVAIETDIEDFPINSKTAIYVGIIINELFTNIFKYAFQGKVAGRIIIRLVKDGPDVTLTVKDDGIGIDERVAANMTPGYGLFIVNMLVEQLKGTYIIENDNGTRSTLCFQV